MTGWRTFRAWASRNTEITVNKILSFLIFCKAITVYKAFLDPPFPSDHNNPCPKSYSQIANFLTYYFIIDSLYVRY